MDAAKWLTVDNIPLPLMLTDSLGMPITGVTPLVSIRRLSDNQYWNGTGWQAGKFDFSMVEQHPGAYLYTFMQSTIAAANSYGVLYQYVGPPAVYAYEVHKVVTTLIDAPALVDLFWDEPKAGHLLAGTVGESIARIDDTMTSRASPADVLASETAIRGVDGDTLKTLSDQLDLVYSPSGLFQVTIVVSDQFAATVENMQVAIYDNANLVLLRRGVTDSLGRYTVAIDPGNYKVRLSAHWYDATVPENLVVAGDMTQAYSVTAWVPSPPAAAQLCVVYGTIIDASGVAVPNAAVRFKTLLPAIFDNGSGEFLRPGARTQAAGTIVEATTDASGYFEAQLVRNAVVSVKVPSCGIDATRTVPDAVSQEFTAWEDDE